MLCNSCFCCRDIDPVEDTESNGDNVRDRCPDFVAGISIRLRILKASTALINAAVEEVAGISIRLRILKGPFSPTSLTLLGEVAGISIRLRILKGSSCASLSRTCSSCRDIDPVEDTERMMYKVFREHLFPLQGYRSG